MRRICVVTTSRADYGLLRWLLADLEREPEVELRLVATGSHLSRLHGATVSEIEADGRPIHDRIEMSPAVDSPSAVGKAVGLGTILFSECFRRLRPDLVVVLGDRYELLSAATAAMFQNIPIAHLHGGEATEGLVDDAIRHAVTKMAHLHFASARVFADRIARMGEDPSRVFVVGAFGLDALERIRLLDRDGLDHALGTPHGAGLLAVTFHPLTLEPRGVEEQLAALETALDAALEDDARLHLVWTLPNADAGNASIRRRVEAFRDARPGRVSVFESLGQTRYLSLLRHCRAVVGNSSSGLIEAPSFGAWTIDVGDRQKGRPRADSVVSCPADAGAVGAALRDVLGRRERAMCANPYGEPGAARRTARILAEHPLDGILRKGFHDAGTGP